MKFAPSNKWTTAAGPILFGALFIAPLIAQSLEAASLPAPFGLQPLYFGLGIGLTLGVVAALRGRWI